MRVSSTVLLAAVAFTLVALLYPAPVSAQSPDSHQVHRLLGHRQSCSHVIDLMLRYGGRGANRYHSSGDLIQPTAYGPAVVPHAEIGDLELVSVTVHSEGDASCGPTFGVTVRNHSQREVSDFQISIVGVLHRLHPWSPTTVHTVDKICAGEVLECQISLPVEALSMGRAGEQVLCLQTVVVAIDSYDQLVECDESNNLKVVALADLPRAVLVSEQVGGETAPASVVPDNSTDPGIDVTPDSNQPAQPSQPGDANPDANPESSIDDLDFNNLDLSEAAAAVSRF